ncbi:hypothetical protein AVEN_64036-1 [Araneus ventricosus]|uniref:Uncharacterized protein n=1 Tax=Araneus ventricosus TaxID=182803 RepID=A0A4Y2WKE9_ARAVE|nr:hypothetical protein AVEN_64036-1 [Araneus ventricosus]
MSIQNRPAYGIAATGTPGNCNGNGARCQHRNGERVRNGRIHNNNRQSPVINEQQRACNQRRAVRATCASPAARRSTAVQHHQREQRVAIQRMANTNNKIRSVTTCQQRTTTPNAINGNRGNAVQRPSGTARTNATGNSARKYAATQQST